MTCKITFYSFLLIHRVKLHPLSALSLHHSEPDDKERSCVPSKHGVLHPTKRTPEGTFKKAGSQALKVFHA